jgi:hypothetical protein
MEDAMEILPLSRRRVVILGSALAILSVTHSVSAATAKTIDRRVRSERKQYGLTFAAEAPSGDSRLGHAFIVWQHEDDAANMSVADAIGFYPKDAGLRVIFGTPGSLDSDLITASDLRLTVLLNSEQFDAAESAKSAWMADGTYQLAWRNCTTHVAAIAAAVGLTTSSGTWEYPMTYVQDLMDNNN